eukprot:Tamp_06150.p1 GENE.Tamp_06150~~Tamp_06150.p1  ORF type:complete len:436 (+),score=71.60 Tamp_06150:227-1534(+)
MSTTGEGDGAASNGSSFTHAQWPAPQHGIQSLPPKEKQKARDAVANPGAYEQAMRPQEHSGHQGNNGKASKYMRLRTTAGADGSHAEQAVRGSAGASSAESDKNAVSACQRQLCRLVGNFLRNAPGPRPAHGALAALHPPPAPRLSAVVSMAVDDVPTVLVPGRVPLGQQQQRRVLGWACVGGRPTCVDGLLRQASDPLVLMSTLGGIDVQSGENEQQWRARVCRVCQRDGSGRAGVECQGEDAQEVFAYVVRAAPGFMAAVDRAVWQARQKGAGCMYVSAVVECADLIVSPTWLADGLAARAGRARVGSASFWRLPQLPLRFYAYLGSEDRRARVMQAVVKDKDSADLEHVALVATGEDEGLVAVAWGNMADPDAGLVPTTHGAPLVACSQEQASQSPAASAVSSQFSGAASVCPSPHPSRDSMGGCVNRLFHQ